MNKVIHYEMYVDKTNVELLIFSYPDTSLRDNRSVRKDCTHAKWQTSQEEENEHQEMHTESILQRVIYF